MNSFVIIAKKELKELFDQPGIYVLIVAFLSLTSYFFFRVAYLNDIASLFPLFEYLPLFMMFFIPAVTMRTLAAEKREGTLEILLTRPLTEWHIVIGKALGILFFAFLVMLLTLTIPFSLLLGSRLDLGIATAQYLGSLLIIMAFVSIGIFSSSLTQNQTISYIISLIINFIFLATGFDIVRSALPYALTDAVQVINMQEHFKGITRGVIDFSDVLFFFSLSACFIALTYVFINRGRFYGKGKAYHNIKQFVFLFIIAVLIVNFITKNTVFRFDLTSEKIYSISTDSIKFVRSLKKPINVKVFVSSSLPPEAEQTFKDIEYFLKNITKQSAGKINYAIKNIDRDETARFEANLAGLRPVNFNIISRDEFQIKQGFFGLTAEEGNKQEVIPYIGSISNFEYQLLTLVNKVSEDKKSKIAYLTGNRERGLNREYRLFKVQASEYYDIDELSVNEEMDRIPDKYKTVIVGGPQRFVRESEQELIGKFVKEDGGSALILMEGIEMDSEQYNVKRNMNAIMKSFSEELGMTVREDLLHDLRSNETVASGNPNGFMASYPPWLRVLVPKDNPISKDVGSIVLPWASSIELDKKKLKDAEIIILYSTSPFTKSEKEPYTLSLNNRLAEDTKNLRVFDVAIAIKYPSGGRMVFVSDSDFLLDIFVGSHPENLVFALNAIDWLTQESSFAGLRSKNVAPRKLLFASDAVKFGVKYGNMLGVPFLVAIYGFIRLLKRRFKARSVYEILTDEK